ncbi:uncharacterized protein [Procambarus clarkii]|uniref:uncharacterized protein isoform X2 n=1 Tax=Procambarus clarkii TaxID=6728 RepID=UPI001E678D2C|nr:uncharacterized protein LOC123754479 isoform X2 [Procambarus clarkii]
MEDNTIEPPSGAFGIPKWMMKKGMSNVVVSACVWREDTIKLLQSSFLVRDGSTVITTVCSSEHLDSTSPEAALIISPGGLSTNTAAVSASKVAAENYDVQPLFVLNFGETESVATEGESLKAAESTQTLHPVKEGFASIYSNSVNGSCNEILITGPSPSEKCSPTSKTDDKKLGLLEKVTLIPSNRGGSHPTHLATPSSSPLASPKASPKPRRSVMGVVMEGSNKSSVHSYFCTKPFQGHQEGSNTTHSISEEVREISLSSLRTQQLEDATKTSQSFDSNSKAIAVKRRQRPKPSALREMNFWAPTSM